ncbi:TetR/AcrR family transcriptional regulator [Streptosporangium sandarakinum]|uniref:TetR/AcrR family transcriptional regulator n=1 Tax=Streptosporangium sandarakinum TaxID=1260955 RepID=UPI0036B0ED78
MTPPKSRPKDPDEPGTAAEEPAGGPAETPPDAAGRTEGGRTEGRTSSRGTGGPGAGGRGMRADARRNRARILAAAGEVFAEKGPAASTEEVAAKAGVAVGTVFKHFPTKRDLLQAIMKDLLAGLTREVEDLTTGDDPAAALFGFMERMVEQAAHKRTVVGLLAEADAGIQVADALLLLREGIETLLTRAQQAGAVREDACAAEVIALLTGLCQGALHARWSPGLRRRTLAIVTNGLRTRPGVGAEPAEAGPFSG